jgi:hypothetical protein
MSRTGGIPTTPGLDHDQVARLRRWLDEGADIFEALGGGAAAWQACRARGAGLRRLDLVLEHLEVLAHARETTGLPAPARRREAA